MTDSFGMLTKDPWVPDTVSLSTSTCVYSLLSKGISSPFHQAPRLAHVLKVSRLFALPVARECSGSWGKEKYQKMIAKKMISTFRDIPLGVQRDGSI